MLYHLFSNSAMFYQTSLLEYMLFFLLGMLTRQRHYPVYKPQPGHDFLFRAFPDPPGQIRALLAPSLRCIRARMSSLTPYWVTILVSVSVISQSSLPSQIVSPWRTVTMLYLSLYPSPTARYLAPSRCSKISTALMNKINFHGTVLT